MQQVIPMLVLGESPAPHTAKWDVRLRTPCALTRVAGEGELQKAIDAALAESDTLLLVGGFGGEDLPSFTLLSQMLSQSLLMDESNLSLRLVGEEQNAGAVLSAKGVRIYACSALPARREEMLEEIQRHVRPKAAPNPENPWLPAPPPEPTELAPTESQPPPAPPVRQTAPRPRKISLKPLLTVLVSACLAFCIGAGYLVYYAADTGLQEARAREVQALYTPTPEQDDPQGEDTPQGEGNAQGEDNAPRGGDGVLQKFRALRAFNSDCVGWLSIPGAGINLPVMLEPTNTYYLTHDVQRNKSRFGALFLDSGNQVSRAGQSANLAIFGHDTKNGSMFGQLRRYRELEFYRENAVIQFDTLYAQQRWVVFAVFITNASPVQDYGYVFEWREQSAAAPENIESFAQALKKRSILNTGVDVRPGDRLLSLTTCTYEIKQGRLVVCARALREGEAPPDTRRAELNPAPLYPAAWYVNYGGRKPD